MPEEPLARNLTEADVAALCEALVPELEKRLADRFFAAAGRGILGGAWANIVKPILIALIFMGLVAIARNPAIITQAVEKTG